jgi:hypothetical protein
MHNLKRNGSRCDFDVKTKSGFANSIRRVLLMDVERWAPHTITFKKNTSSQTDEHIAHRIGLIPFTPVDIGTEGERGMELSVTGREVMSHDLQGDAFRPVHDIPIVLLTQSQTLALVVKFARGRARDHVRYAMIGPVSYSVTQKVTHIGFETISNECPVKYLLDALIELQTKVRDVILFVESEYDNRRVLR